jgi:hypothetical protein
LYFKVDLPDNEGQDAIFTMRIERSAGSAVTLASAFVVSDVVVSSFGFAGFMAQLLEGWLAGVSK